MSGRARPVFVRWDPEMGEFEAQCGDCAAAARRSYWPLTRDFWDPRLGVQRCRACQNTRRRLARRAKIDVRAKARAYYHGHREHRLAWRKAWHAANRERVNAERRAAYAAKRAAARAEGLFDA
jgi:hypothetical protein